MFYSCFCYSWNAVKSGREEELSAKWRRTKKFSKHFNISTSFSKIKDKNPASTFRTKDLARKRQAYPRWSRTPKTCGARKVREPDPLIDVLEEKEEIVVVAEFAGFKRENLRTNVKNQRLTLSAEVLDRKYYKSLNLPKRVIPNTIRTTYKNGVLEIRLKKSIEEKSIDRLAG